MNESQDQNLIYRSQSYQQLKPKMKIATTALEKNKIYRLRYNISIVELNEPLISVSHDQKLIKDELDLTATHIGAFMNDEAVGACRLNFVDNNYSDEMNIYDLDRFDHTNSNDIVIASKLFIEKKFRGTGLSSVLLNHMYALAVMQESKVALICVPNSWVSVFSNYGFITYKGTALHPELGQVVPLYLDLQNEKFMMDISSPFYKLFKAFKYSSENGFLN